MQDKIFTGHQWIHSRGNAQESVAPCVVGWVVLVALTTAGLAALEVLVDELGGALGIVLDVVAQGAVVERAQLLDDAVDHVGTEDTLLLEGATQLLQAVGAGDTAVRQAVELVEAVGVGGIVDIDVNIGLGSEFQSVLHLEAVAASYAQAGKQLIDVG